MTTKRFVLLAMSILAGAVCNAQLRPPVQTDSLVITGVKYNYADIRKENWPCSVIYKSTTMFTIGDSQFKIHGAHKGVGEIYFQVMDYPPTNLGKMYTLTYSEIEDDVIRIAFSGYEFTCKPHLLQTSDNSGVGDEAAPLQMVEVKPSFMGGGANEFSEWVNQRLNYPEIAKENGVQGRVLLQFTIDIDGSVKDVKVFKGVDSSLDAEAVRVVSMSPKWEPGKIDGKPVAVTYIYPVIFQLL